VSFDVLTKLPLGSEGANEVGGAKRLCVRERERESDKEVTRVVWISQTITETVDESHTR